MICWGSKAFKSCGDDGSPPATKSLMLESIMNTQAAPGYCSRKQPKSKIQIQNQLVLWFKHACINLWLQEKLRTCVWSCVCADAGVLRRCHRPYAAEWAALGSWCLQTCSSWGNPSHPPVKETELSMIQPLTTGGQCYHSACMFGVWSLESFMKVWKRNYPQFHTCK